MWLIGAMVCLLAAPWVRLSVSAGNGWPHNALRHHRLMPISCHFRDYKALLVTSLTHVSVAIASIQTFTFFTFTFVQHYNCMAKDISLVWISASIVFVYNIANTLSESFDAVRVAVYRLANWLLRSAAADASSVSHPPGQ